MSDHTGALILITASTIYLAGAGVMVVAACIVRARNNARIRATRRQMHNEVVERALEQLHTDREFAAIVARLKADAS